jgi:diacylglycerol O-acyltransferase
MTSRFRRLSLADLTNLAVEAGDTPMHVGALGTLDAGTLLDDAGRIRIAAIRARIEGRLNRLPELRRRLLVTRPFQGRPLWIDDAGFRIENHVRNATLDPPGGEEQAIRFAEGSMQRLMDRSRPLWELWFLDGYAPDEVAVFLKLHHVLADGSAVLNMISLLFDLEPGVVDTPSPPWSPLPQPSPSGLIWDNVKSKLAAAFSLTRGLVHLPALTRAAVLSARGLWATLTEGLGSSRTSFNRPVGATRKVAVVRIGLAEARSLAHSLEAKVNDVILDVITGGLRRVLLSRGERIDRMEIKASMAVSLRSADRAAVVGNHTGTMIVALPVDQADGPKRLANIHAATTRAKLFQRAAVPQSFMTVLALTGLTRFFIRRQRLVNVLVTNLAGPPMPLYVAGARLLDAFAITPVAGNVTASFAALSYHGHLDLCVNADAGAWPDLDQLVAGMRATWRDMAAHKIAA